MASRRCGRRLVRVFLRSICTLKGVQELDAFLDKMATEDGAFSPV